MWILWRKAFQEVGRTSTYSEFMNSTLHIFKETREVSQNPASFRNTSSLRAWPAVLRKNQKLRIRGKDNLVFLLTSSRISWNVATSLWAGTFPEPSFKWALSVLASVSWREPWRLLHYSLSAPWRTTTLLQQLRKRPTSYSHLGPGTTFIYCCANLKLVSLSGLSRQSTWCDWKEIRK